MLRWTALILVAPLALGCDLFNGDDDLVDPASDRNPDYIWWSDFEPGAYATYTETERGPGGRKEVRYKLVELEDDKAVVEIRTGAPDLTSSDARTQVREMTEKVDPEQKPRLVEQGRETLEVAGKKLDCQVYRQIGYREGGRVLGDEREVIKLWIHEDVPGGIVRMTHQPDNASEPTMTRMLVDFGTEDGALQP